MCLVLFLELDQVSLFLFQPLHLFFREADEIVRICPVVGIDGIERTGSQAKNLGLPGRFIKGLPDCDEMVLEQVPVGWNEVFPVGWGQPAIDKVEALEIAVELRLVLVELIAIVVQSAG